MSANMSRKQYMQMNPMFDRLKNIESMMKKATPIIQKKKVEMAQEITV